LYISVIFPLALPEPYTYVVPQDLQGDIAVGKRVEAPLKNKLYAGIVTQIKTELANPPKNTKEITSILDKQPIVSLHQLKLWHWIASYYCCSLGEVMNAALPTSLKLESETKVIAHPDFDEIDIALDDDEYMVAEAVSIQNELTVGQIQDILNRKTIYPVIRSLLDKGYISIKEELIEKYKPKMVPVIYLNDNYKGDGKINDAFALVTKSELQTRSLLGFVQLSRDKDHKVLVSDLRAIADVDSAVIKSIANKGIFTIVQEQQSRANLDHRIDLSLSPLNEHQAEAYAMIKAFHAENKAVMLHGITGSGKTRLYVELIKEVVAEGKQVLLLLPEIALTSHIVERLRHQIESPILSYHSRLNNNERVDIWNEVARGAQIVVSARSGLFLPFNDLGLVIVDEEHDPSYKQQDPNPRYNARDGALYLAKIFEAKVVLGSATPSLESYYNCFKQKYGLVSIMERHGASVLPNIEVIDLKKSYKDKRFDGMLSPELKDAIEQVLELGEQVLIFQNRRGYAPTLRCQSCGWHSECNNCDVHLTLHKGIKMLKCHYCGTKTKQPLKCPDCGSPELEEQGFGTEKIEEHFKEVFPNARIARVDLDTVRSKLAYEKIIYEFENKEIDILIGTQMITKGLDFDHISLVGVINADGLLRYPNIRSNERGFQLLTQVAGRAGRREKQGRVIIQSYTPEHPVLHETVNHLYASFYQREMAERKAFMYPPYYRMIAIDFEHKNAETTLHAAQVFVSLIKPELGNRVMGPSEPPINRIRGSYIQNVTIKYENDPNAATKIKKIIAWARLELKQIKACKPVRVVVDVDPY
jgi:primosomal protein N' (replication factor Y)